MVYCYGVKEGGDDAFNKVKELYYAETVQLEKDYLLRGLGCHKNITALKGLLLLALDRNSSFVRLQDLPDVFLAVSENPVGKEFMFNFLLERRTFSKGNGVAQKKLRNLQKNGRHGRDFRAFDEEIEREGQKIKWIKKHFKKLSEFFKNHHPSDDTTSSEELRLPTSIKPVLYDLTIKTYLPGYVKFPPEKNLTFDGQVGISMVVVEPTKSIVLNAKKITVIPEKCEVFAVSLHSSIGEKQCEEKKDPPKLVCREPDGDWITSKFKTTSYHECLLICWPLLSQNSNILKGARKAVCGSEYGHVQRR
ncbi:hypothetical protein OSTOST_19138 [Ostertagia ostertagi]